MFWVHKTNDFLFTCINSSAADLLNMMLNATWILDLHSRKKPAVLLVPTPHGFANCPPDISLWSRVKRERANAVKHREDTTGDAQTDLQQISSWSATADSRSRPAGCHSPRACCPRLWTGLRAGTVSGGLLSSGTGPEGHPRLWDTDTDAGVSTADY